MTEILTVIIAFLAPISPLIITVGLFILADTLMGIFRSKKLGQKITSRKMSNIVSKMVLYQSAIILFFVLEKFVVGEFVVAFSTIPFFLTKVVASTLCFIEIKSIDESWKQIYGFSIWSRFKLFLKRANEIKEDFKSKE